MKSINLRRSLLFCFVLVGGIALGACTSTGEPKVAPNQKPETPVVKESPVNTSPSPQTADKPAGGVDALLGAWTGDTDTRSLTVAKSPTGYSIVIKNGDKSETFAGAEKDGMIEFTRNGKAETLKAAKGSDTGIKAFEKATGPCVVISKGSEAYCKKQ
jgi:hypothetical protein